MGRRMIEIRISKSTGKSAENSVMGLMPILFCCYREDVIWVKIMGINLIKVGSGN